MATADDVRNALGRLYYNENDRRRPPMFVRVEGWTRTSLDEKPPWRRVYASVVEDLILVDHETCSARLPATAANVLMDNIQEPIKTRKRERHHVLTLTSGGELKFKGTQFYFKPVDRPLKKDMIFTFSGY